MQLKGITVCVRQSEVKGPQQSFGALGVVLGVDPVVGDDATEARIHQHLLEDVPLAFGSEAVVAELGRGDVDVVNA